MNLNNIAGSVLPIKRAEELILTLPGVVSAKIIESESGAVEQIHVLTTAELTPKQVVRNIESALMAHLAMRVDHRKISVAITSEPKPKPQPARPTPHSQFVAPQFTPAEGVRKYTGRRLYFEDVEVRGSRSKGVSCRVTLRKGEESFIGEAHGIEGDRSRLDLAARATVFAIGSAEGQIVALRAKADASFYALLTADQKTKLTNLGTDFFGHGLGDIHIPGGGR